MGDLLGPDPLAGIVPAHAGFVAEGDVFDVEEDLLFALPVPDLVAGVAGVLEDGAYRALGPGDAAAVRIAVGVVGGGARDVVASEAFGDGVESAAAEAAGQELAEDPLDDPADGGVELQAVKPLSVGGLRRVGMRPGVAQEIAVRGSAAQVSALDEGLGRHGGADADLDAVAFALAHAAEDGHDKVVGFAVGVDRAADFGHPQLDAVVGEEGVGETVLVVVEDTLRFADHDRAEPPVGVLERVEECGGSWTSAPGQGARVPDVEVLGDDAPADRFDQSLGPVQLPGTRGRRVLQILGRAPTGEGETDHAVLLGQGP
nr:hypothetical protein [Streptomyces sp. CBMA152]